MGFAGYFLIVCDFIAHAKSKGIAVGPGRVSDEGEKRIPLDVKVGDTVLYSKYGGTEVKYGGEEYLILSARDVLAIIEK